MSVMLASQGTSDQSGVLYTGNSGTLSLLEPAASLHGTESGRFEKGLIVGLFLSAGLWALLLGSGFLAFQMVAGW